MAGTIWSMFDNGLGHTVSVPISLTGTFGAVTDVPNTPALTFAPWCPSSPQVCAGLLSPPQRQFIPNLSLVDYSTAAATTGPTGDQFGDGSLGSITFENITASLPWGTAAVGSEPVGGSNLLSQSIFYFSQATPPTPSQPYWFGTQAFSGGLGASGYCFYYDAAGAKMYSAPSNGGTQYFCGNNVTDGTTLYSPAAVTSVLTVSSNDTIYERSGCLGTDGKVYCVTDLGGDVTTAQLSQINPATPVETAKFKSVLLTNSGNFSSSDSFMLVPFALSGTNYVAICQDFSSTTPNFEMVNVDSLSSAATGTYPDGGDETMMCLGASTAGQQSLYILTNIFTAPELIRVDFTGTLSFTSIKTYAPTDFDAGWGSFSDYGGLTFDLSDGNIVFQIETSGLLNGGPVNNAYLVKVNAATGAIIWKIPLPYCEDYYYSSISWQCDLTGGSLVMPVIYGGNWAVDYMDGAGQAVLLTIDTAAGSYTTSINKHLYRRNSTSVMWDNSNGRLIYYDGGAGDYSTSPAWDSGFAIFEAAFAVNDNRYWTRTNLGTPWNDGGTLYDFVSDLAYSPTTPSVLYAFLYPNALGESAQGNAAIASFDTASGTRTNAAVVDTDQSTGLGPTDGLRSNKLVIAPDGSVLAYWHAGTSPLPSDFPTSHWMQAVDPSTLTVLTRSQTPAEAGAASAPWTDGVGIPVGPTFLQVSQNGRYVFATFPTYTSPPYNGFAYMLWDRTGGTTHYGTMSDISGFTYSNYLFTNTIAAVFDENDDLWVNLQLTPGTHMAIVRFTISGGALAFAASYSYSSIDSGFSGTPLALIYVPGTTPLSGSLTEAADATDSISGVLGVPAALSEAANATDTISAVATPQGQRPTWITIDADTGDSIFPL